MPVNHPSLAPSTPSSSILPMSSSIPPSRRTTTFRRSLAPLQQSVNQRRVVTPRTHLYQIQTSEYPFPPDTPELEELEEEEHTDVSEVVDERGRGSWTGLRGGRGTDLTEESLILEEEEEVSIRQRENSRLSVTEEEIRSHNQSSFNSLPQIIEVEEENNLKHPSSSPSLPTSPSRRLTQKSNPNPLLSSPSFLPPGPRIPPRSTFTFTSPPPFHLRPTQSPSQEDISIRSSDGPSRPRRSEVGEGDASVMSVGRRESGSNQDFEEMSILSPSTVMSPSSLPHARPSTIGERSAYDLSILPTPASPSHVRLSAIPSPPFIRSSNKSSPMKVIGGFEIPPDDDDFLMEAVEETLQDVREEMEREVSGLLGGASDDEEEEEEETTREERGDVTRDEEGQTTREGDETTIEEGVSGGKVDESEQQEQVEMEEDEEVVVDEEEGNQMREDEDDEGYNSQVRGVEESFREETAEEELERILDDEDDRLNSPISHVDPSMKAKEKSKRQSVNKQSSKPKRQAGLPKAYIKEMFLHYLGPGAKLEPDVLDYLVQDSSSFLSNLGSLSSLFSSHASRKTIQESDILAVGYSLGIIEPTEGDGGARGMTKLARELGMSGETVSQVDGMRMRDGKRRRESEFEREARANDGGKRRKVGE